MVVIAAVDRSHRANDVVDEAASLAKAFDDPLHVIHVMSESDFIELQLDSSDKGGKPVDIDEVHKRAAEQAKNAAEILDIPYETVGLMGKVRQEVIRYANDKDARYIVIGGRKRSPTGKALFGSTTQSILLNADRSVVSVITKE